jgi:hypothetical protein
VLCRFVAISCIPCQHLFTRLTQRTQMQQQQQQQQAARERGDAMRASLSLGAARNSSSSRGDRHASLSSDWQTGRWQQPAALQAGGSRSRGDDGSSRRLRRLSDGMHLKHSTLPSHLLSSLLSACAAASPSFLLFSTALSPSSLSFSHDVQVVLHQCGSVH